MCLQCKLVPVHYQEYQYSLLRELQQKHVHPWLHLKPSLQLLINNTTRFIEFPAERNLLVNHSNVSFQSSSIKYLSPTKEIQKSQTYHQELRICNDLTWSCKPLFSGTKQFFILTSVLLKPRRGQGWKGGVSSERRSIL